MALLIDGKQISQTVVDEVAVDAKRFKQRYGFTPGLAVVLVGEDPASQVYVRNKVKRANEIGLKSVEHVLPVNCTQETLVALIKALNADATVHGILVQLPLPDHLNEDAVIEVILPEKDVDGFHPLNVGALACAKASLIPCTPLGCMLMLKHVLGNLSGKNAVVVGRSNIVGKPMAALLLQENCTVTVVHSRTKNIEAICSQADILVVAIGRCECVKSNWVKPGATVIDVGINAIVREGRRKLVGDVDFVNVEPVAAAITPVPGGVGPMTIACLMKNTLTAAYALEAKSESAVKDS